MYLRSELFEWTLALASFYPEFLIRFIAVNPFTCFGRRGVLHSSFVSKGLETRYVKLRVAHAPGMPGTFCRHRLQRKPLVSDPGMHYGTCVTHVQLCISLPLARGGGKNVPGNPQFYVSGKRPITRCFRATHGNRNRLLTRFVTRLCHWMFLGFRQLGSSISIPTVRLRDTVWHISLFCTIQCILDTIPIIISPFTFTGLDQLSFTCYVTCTFIMISTMAQCFKQHWCVVAFWSGNLNQNSKEFRLLNNAGWIDT